jgi:hypothetical protein
MRRTLGRAVLSPILVAVGALIVLTYNRFTHIITLLPKSLAKKNNAKRQLIGLPFCIWIEHERKSLL